MDELEITTITIAGREFPAHLLICPACHVVDLDLTVDTNATPWKALCTKGHEWALAESVN